MEARELEALNQKIAGRRDERARAVGALEQSQVRAKAEFGVDIVVEERPDPEHPGGTILHVDTSAADTLLSSLETRLRELDAKVQEDGTSLKADLLAAGF